MSIISSLNARMDLDNRREIIGMFEKYNDSRKICDIGPGSSPLADDYPGENKLYGIEYPGYSEKTIGVLDKIGKNITIKECDLDQQRWPFDDNYFDIVISNQVLEHMVDTDHFIQEFYRIMKVGGYGFISTPNLSSLCNILQLIFTFQPVICAASDKFNGIGNPLASHRGQIITDRTHNHLRVFSLRALEELLKINGFKIEKKRGGAFLGIPAIDRFIARVLPWYGYFCTIKIRK